MTDVATPAVPTRTVDGVEVPEAGTYSLDVSHSHVGFSVRHLMVSKTKGEFTDFQGTIVIAEDPLESSVEVEIKPESVSTRDEQRDGHLKSADFFDVENHPTMEFHSTGVRIERGDFLVDGNLTIRGVTRPVTFDFDFGGFGTDPYGNYKAGATAKAVIDREDFGLTWNAALETGGVLVGKDVTIELDLQGALQQD